MGNRSTPRSVWLLLTLVVLLGGYLRIVGTLDARVTHPVYSDARDYWAYGTILNESGIFSRKVWRTEEDEKPLPDAVRAQGYPAVSALLMRLLPERYWYRSVIWLQIALGVGLIGLTFRLFRFLLPPSWALAPAVLVAVSPHLIMLGAYLLSEVLFTFALLPVFLLVR